MAVQSYYCFKGAINPKMKNIYFLLTCRAVIQLDCFVMRCPVLEILAVEMFAFSSMYWNYMALLIMHRGKYI